MSRFPQNTRFLVTGGAGFIGSNLTLRIIKEGCQVTVLDNLLTGLQSNIDEIMKQAQPGQVRLIRGDIRDPQACLDAVQGADYVLHQAALGSVPRSLEDPATTHAINVDGTVNMLLAAKKASVKRFVYASSSSVYGNAEVIPNEEGKEAEPLSPYAVSKKVNELYAACFTRAFGLPTIGLRYFNVFGPRQNPDSPYAAVIPLFIQAARTKRPMVIYGDGLQSRDFTFVDNVIQANLAACNAPESVFGKAYNVACGDSYSVVHLAEQIRKLVGSDVPPKFAPARSGDIRKSCAKIEQARIAFGYEPMIRLSEGLVKTTQWFTA